MKLPTSLTIKVVGQDPSLRNWGLAIGEYNLSTNKVTIHKVSVINPVLITGKQTRQNSLDIQAAEQLFQQAASSTKNADVVFVEVPVGSQSA